jgi:hypothetical protein
MIQNSSVCEKPQPVSQLLTPDRRANAAAVNKRRSTARDVTPLKIQDIWTLAEVSGGGRGAGAGIELRTNKLKSRCVFLERRWPCRQFAAGRFG